MKNRFLIFGLIIVIITALAGCSFAYIYHYINSIPIGIETASSLQELRTHVKGFKYLPVIEDEMINDIHIIYDSFNKSRQLYSYIIFCDDFTIGCEIGSGGIINPNQRDGYKETVMFNELAIYVFYEYNEDSNTASLSMLTLMNNHNMYISATKSDILDSDEYYNEFYPIFMKIMTDTLGVYYDSPVW